MADNSICKIADCGKPTLARGWCRAHYKRWRRHGDPLVCKKAANGEARSFYRDVVLAYDGDECLTWPYGKVEGYGVLGNKIVSRLVCIDANGQPPTPKHQAAHSCGNGHEGCVTKGHLSWKTNTANQADRLVHGTSNRGERHGLSKLKAGDAALIMEMKGKKSLGEIGEMFGVTRGTVHAIHSGRTWAWLSLTTGQEG